MNLINYKKQLNNTKHNISEFYINAKIREKAVDKVIIFSLGILID